MNNNTYTDCPDSCSSCMHSIFFARLIDNVAIRLHTQLAIARNKHSANEFVSFVFLFVRSCMAFRWALIEIYLSFAHSFASQLIAGCACMGISFHLSTFDFLRAWFSTIDLNFSPQHVRKSPLTRGARQTSLTVTYSKCAKYLPRTNGAPKKKKKQWEEGDEGKRVQEIT